MAIVVVDCGGGGRWGRQSMAVLVVDGGGGKWRVCRRWPAMSTSTLTEAVVVNGGGGGMEPTAVDGGVVDGS